MARNCTKFAILINANKKVLLLSLSFHQKREETLTSATYKQAFDFPMKFMSFSEVRPLEKVKIIIIKSCGILILEKTENSLENVYYKEIWRKWVSLSNSSPESKKVGDNVIVNYTALYIFIKK